MAGLPAEIRAIAEHTPLEDLMLAVLRDGLPGIQVSSLISPDQTFPMVLARKVPGFHGSGDPRFIEAGTVAIDCMVEDPDGDEDAGILSEAVRVVMRDAWLKQKTFPGLGHITYFDSAMPARRVTDWATSTGPVQYADLPTGVYRYQALYNVEIKKPSARPYPMP